MRRHVARNVHPVHNVVTSLVVCSKTVYVPKWCRFESFKNRVKTGIMENIRFKCSPKLLCINKKMIVNYLYSVFNLNVRIEVPRGQKVI